MSIRKTVLPVVAAAAIAIAVTACGGAPAPQQGNPAAATGPQYNPQPYANIKDGGTLTSGLREIPAQLNVMQGDTTGWSGNLWPWTNPVLVTYTLDGSPEFNPDYLTDVKQDEVGGNTRVTYTINPKAVFNDGTPFDWKVFEGTWKAVKGDTPDYFVGAVNAGYSRIASVVRGADDRQAVVTFTGGFVGWQALFGNVLHPQASATPDAFNKAYIDNPHPEWGAGPYTVGKFDRKAGIATYVRNPKWWGEKGKLDTVNFQQLEQTASINAFRNGQIDYTSASSKERLEQVKGMPGVELRRGEIAQIGVYTLNAKSPVLSDKRVRKAILMGIDRDQLSKITSQGLGFTEDLAGSLALIPSQKGYRDNLAKVLSFDPAKAKADLDAAGWAPGADGIRVKDGAPLKFTHVRSGDSELSRATASALIAMMKAIGVQLDVRQVASAEFSNVINGRTFDMFSWSYNQPDPFGMAYLCDLYCTTGSSNLSGTGSAELDAKLRTITGLPNADQQNAAGNDLEVEALSDYGLIMTSPLPTVYAVKAGLANVGALPFTVPLPQYVGWQK